LAVLRYSRGIVNWCQKELQKLDRKTRKLPTIHGQHHTKADADCLYVTRKQRGRGLTQLEGAHAVEITKLVEFVDSKADPLIQIVRTHQHTSTQQCYRQLDASRQKYRVESIAQKTIKKNGKGRGYMDNCHVTGG
jgi:hypothetical protein